MKNKSTNKIIGDSFIFTTTTILMKVAGIFRGLLISYFLKPNQYGILNGLYLIPHYGSSSDLGVAAGMGRFLPHHLGKNDKTKAEKVIYTTFNFMLIAAGTVTIMILAWCFFNQKNVPKEILFGVIAFSLISFILNLRKYFFVFFRSYHNFTFLSQENILDSALGLILVVLLVYKFNLYGAYISLLLTSFACTYFLFKRSGFRLKWVWDKPEFKELIKLGMPLLLLGFLDLVLTSIDRIFILKFYNTTLLGYYAIGASIKTNLITIPFSLSTVFIPKLFQAKKDDYESLVRFFSKPITAITIIVIVTAGCIYAMLPIVYYGILIKYSSGIDAGRVLLISLVFVSIPILANNIFIAVGKLKLLFIIEMASLIFGSLLSLVSIRLNMGILGIAYATLAMSALNAVLLLYFAAKSIYKKTKERFSFLITLFTVVCFGVLVMKLSEAVGSYLFSNHYSGLWLSSFASLITFIIPMLVMLVCLEKRLGVFLLIKDYLGRNKAPGLNEVQVSDIDSC